MELAKKQGFRSIAFPSISIGEDGPITISYIEEAVYADLLLHMSSHISGDVLSAIDK